VKPPSDDKLTGNVGIRQYGLTRSDLDQGPGSTVPTFERAMPIREIRRQFTYRDRR
jgi:putative ABC transport system permease protein